MPFSSVSFLFGMLPLVLLVVWLGPARTRNGVLLAASLVFYTWGGGILVLGLLATALFDWFVLGRIRADRDAGRAAAKRWLAVSVSLNVSLLVWGKAVAARPGAVLPLALSFYTFQRISMAVDVARGEIAERPRFDRYLLVNIFFPHLVAGPIVRWHDMAPDLDTREIGLDQAAQGAIRFTQGLAKKVLIADALAPVVAQAFDHGGATTTLGAGVGALAFTVQLYFDFSGYSDMAVGLGLLLGFHLPENFDRPYSARSVTDFWRRWHKTLTSWFRDYLYLPLGGDQKGLRRTTINLGLVFLATGLWHGFAWHFVAWAVWHGTWLLGERAFGLRALGPDRVRLEPLRRLVTFAMVTIGWVFFRAPGMAEAWTLLHHLLVPTGGLSLGPVADVFGWKPRLALAIGLATALLPRGGPRLLVHRVDLPRSGALRRARVAAGAGVLALLLPLTLLAVASGSFRPFLYFRF